MLSKCFEGVTSSKNAFTTIRDHKPLPGASRASIEFDLSLVPLAVKGALWHPLFRATIGIKHEIGRAFVHTSTGAERRASSERFFPQIGKARYRTESLDYISVPHRVLSGDDVVQHLYSFLSVYTISFMRKEHHPTARAVPGLLFQ